MTKLVKRHVMDLRHTPAMEKLQRSAKMEQRLLHSSCKHFYEGGYRSIAVAVNLLKSGKIIAIPTDTIYGLAGLAQNDYSIKKLYDIKKRDPGKPLAICVWDISDIPNWAETGDLPPELLEKLLPGPVTVVLKRKPSLNPNLNPGIDSVGIRVPHSPFLRTVVKSVGQPLALTSANESAQPSTLYANEFEELWPRLGGIFYAKSKIKENVVRRRGSTIVDLTEKGYYRLIRQGRAFHSTSKKLVKCGLKLIEEEKDLQEQAVAQ